MYPPNVSLIFKISRFLPSKYVSGGFRFFKIFFKLLNARVLEQAETQLNTDLLAFLAIGLGFEIQSTHQFPPTANWRFYCFKSGTNSVWTKLRATYRAYSGSELDRKGFFLGSDFSNRK